MVNNESKIEQELIRFQLNGAGNSEHTALLMCKIYCVDPSQPPHLRKWMMKALGHGCKGRMYSDNVKECQKEMTGRLEIDKLNSYSRYVPLQTSNTKSITKDPQLIQGVDNTVTVLCLIICALFVFILLQRSF